MKIVIDCRYYNNSGIGRYLSGILDELDYHHQITLLGNSEILKPLYPECKIIDDRSNPYTFKGLFVNKRLINQHDLFISPNFLIPFGIKVPTYITIHDLVALDLRETNNGYLDYRIKKALIRRGVKKASAIFTVSEFSKSRILHFFPKLKKPVIVTYTGVSKQLLVDANQMELKPSVVKTNTAIFVGNLKKNKGLIDLLRLWPKIEAKTQMKLIIIGSKENFRTKDDYAIRLLESSNASFSSNLNDTELHQLIQRAKFLIQPSTYEGFGLPPLEALYLKTKPIIANIAVFKEIYQDFPVEMVDFKTDQLIDQIDSFNPLITKPIKNTKYHFERVAQIIFETISQSPKQTKKTKRKG